MANPVTQLLEHVNNEVAKLSTVGLSRLTEVLDAAEKELTQSLASWSALGKGDDRFTPQMYRNAVVQIRGALEHIRGPLAEGVASAMRHGGVLAAHLATGHLINQVTTFSAMFEGTIRPISIEAASILAEGKKLVWPRFSNSAKRYAGQVGEDIRKQLAIGVVKGETVDQLTARLSKLGGPSGLVYTRGQEGSPRAKAEFIAEGLFRRYTHYAERLVVTETVNAYNSFALDGMDELEKEDPGYFKRWDAAIDKRTCPFCGGYDDNVVPLDKTFKGGVNHPPLHPRCRCAVVVWRKEWDEASYKDDLVKETVKGNAVRGVASIPHQIEIPKQKAIAAEKKAAKDKKATAPKDNTLQPKAKMSDADKAAFTQRAEAYSAKLTEEEQKALKKYQGATYENINTYLRQTEKQASKDTEFKKENYKKITDQLDAAIAKGAAEERMIVYRGTRTNVLGKKAKVGDIFQDKAYISTTENQEAIRGLFSSPGGNLFHIEVPKGSKMASLDGVGEYERLLPRNTKLQILGFEDDMKERPDGSKYATGMKIVRARIVE